MHLNVLRVAVRRLIQGAPEGDAERGLDALSAAERAALHTLTEHLRAANGRSEHVLPVGGSSTWLTPPVTDPAL